MPLDILLGPCRSPFFRLEYLLITSPRLALPFRALARRTALPRSSHLCVRTLPAEPTVPLIARPPVLPPPTPHPKILLNSIPFNPIPIPPLAPALALRTGTGKNGFAVCPDGRL
jgi:hypothetical protein